VKAEVWRELGQTRAGFGFHKTFQDDVPYVDIIVTARSAEGTVPGTGESRNWAEGRLPWLSVLEQS